jgi:hypothetical protein
MQAADHSFAKVVLAVLFVQAKFANSGIPLLV